MRSPLPGNVFARRLQTCKNGKEYAFRIHVPLSILERLRSEGSGLLVRVEKIYSVKLAFRADPNYHVGNFKIINALTNKEYR